MRIHHHPQKNAPSGPRSMVSQARHDLERMMVAWEGCRAQNLTLSNISGSQPRGVQVGQAVGSLISASLRCCWILSFTARGKMMALDRRNVCRRPVSFTTISGGLMRQFGKTSSRGTRRGSLAGLQALITMWQLGGPAHCTWFGRRTTIQCLPDIGHDSFAGHRLSEM